MTRKKKDFRPKPCSICGKVFKPRSSTHIRCDGCASVECLQCGILFRPGVLVYKDGGEVQFCSSECYHEHSKLGYYKECPECGETFYVQRTRERIYCSRKCARKNSPPITEETRRKLCVPRWNSRDGIIKRCVNCGRPFYVKKSHMSQEHCSLKCRPVSTLSGFRVGDPRISGKNHWNWKGGVYKAHCSERQYWGAKSIYRNWRKSVLKRDNYTCQFCGKRGGKLHVDHVKPWIEYPELRFDIDNGRVLCQPCHAKTDTYGGKSQRRRRNNNIERAV